MLIKSAILKRIQTGEINLVFRRWKKPTVKTGGSLKTAVGVLAIESVEKSSLRKITKKEALDAGFSSLRALTDELSQREGDIYKIRVSFAGEDPRIALRENTKLTKTEIAEICERLQKLDERSRHGKWTCATLVAIQKNPHLPAIQIAEILGFEKPWLKTNIRKLKSLGLTISHSPGYEISPRGKVILKTWKSGQ